jgi:DNA polymerase III alpha subunit (gram-positive type)
MVNFYFDIETTGLNPKKDKILTIQYQELDRNTGEPIGELKILKEWESSEKEIINKFLFDTHVLDNYPFSFIPVGYNLNFENSFLKERTKINELPSVDILSNPFIDLRVIGILMNKGEFKGSGLDKLTEKKSEGSSIPMLYNNHEYEKIIEYIKQEASEFLKLNIWLYKKLPLLLEQFKENNK